MARVVRPNIKRRARAAMSERITLNEWFYRARVVSGRAMMLGEGTRWTIYSASGHGD